MSRSQGFGRKGLNIETDSRSDELNTSFESREAVGKAVGSLMDERGNPSRELVQKVGIVERQIQARQNALEKREDYYFIPGQVHGNQTHVRSTPSIDVLELPAEVREMTPEQLAGHPNMRILNSKLRARGLETAIVERPKFAADMSDTARTQYQSDEQRLNDYTPTLCVRQIEK